MILITGASSGIGESCARAFAREKQDLLLIARRESKLKSLAEEIRREWQVTVETASVDVSNTESVEQFIRQFGEQLVHVKVLVNNAGLARGLSTIQEGELADWEAMFDTNVKGLLHVTRRLLPYFQRKGEGHIINLGSVAGHYVYPKGNVYCATKFAVHALTEALRIDLNGSGIRVTEISPGMVETDFSKTRLGSEEKAKAVYAGMTPLTPDDVAEAVVWSANRPARVNIQEIVLYPTDQATPTVVHRRT